MLAVAGVASTTLIASGVAWWSFGRVEATLDSVTRNSLPAIASSLQLAERATGITGAAPRILATATQEEREAAVAAVQNGVDQARAELADLADAGVDAEAIARIGADLDRLAGQVGTLDELQAKQIQLNETRSEEHTSEPQSLMRISYAVFCLKKKK